MYDEDRSEHVVADLNQDSLGWRYTVTNNSTLVAASMVYESFYEAIVELNKRFPGVYVHHVCPVTR